jgi:hypothetical protein
MRYLDKAEEWKSRRQSSELNQLVTWAFSAL